MAMAFPTGWTRKSALAISAAEVDATLSDFPVLFTPANLPSEMFDSDGSSPAQSDGGDIRFSSDSAGSNQLACEIVSFATNANPALGIAEIWVKVPTVSSSADTTIYIWYNTAGTESQPAASDTYGRNNVWDANYLGVYHANNESSGATCVDSTGNANQGTVDADDGPQDGAWSNANGSWGLDGAFDDVPTGGSSLLNGLSAMTIESWSYSNRASVSDNDLIFSEDSSGAAGCYLRYDATGFEGGQSNVYQANLTTTGGDDIYESAAGTASTGAWMHVCMKWSSGSPIAMVIDGVSDTPSNSPSSLTGTINDGVDFVWGLRSSTQSLDGRLDECRVSDIARSDEWLSASYSNQFAPGTFATAGTPEDAGGGGGGTAVPVFAHHYRQLATA